MLVGFGLIWIIDNLATLLWTSDVRAVTPSTPERCGMCMPGLRFPFVGLGIIGIALLVIFLSPPFPYKNLFRQVCKSNSTGP